MNLVILLFISSLIIQKIEKRTNEKINTGLDEVTIRNKTMEQYLERTKDVAIQYNNIKKYLIYDLNISTYDCYIYTECYELTTINKYIILCRCFGFLMLHLYFLGSVKIYIDLIFIIIL